MKINVRYVVNLFIVVALLVVSTDYTFAIVDTDTAGNVIQSKTEKVKKNKKKVKVEEQREQVYTNDVHSTFTLNDCIEIAIKNNPSIQSAIYNEAVYKSKIGQEWANYFPVINAGLNLSRSRNKYSPSTYQGYMGVYNTMGYVPNISADMLIFDFGKTKAAADKAKRTYESKKEDTQENINDIIYSIKATYFNILFAQAQVRVYEETVNDFAMQAKQALGFYTLGKKAKLDVVTAEYNLEKAKLNLVKAKSVLKIAQVQLSKIMGIPEYTNYELVDKLLLDDYEQTVDELLQKAYEVRPELISAKKSMEASKMDLRLKRRDFAPNLGVFASYNNGLGNDYNLSSAQFGVGLDYKALNILKTKQKINEAKSMLNKAQADYENVRQTVYLNVQKNYIDLKTSKESILIAKLSLDRAKEQYRQVTGRYKAGIGDAIELKDGENTYLNARLDFYNTILNYNLNVASLEKEVGVPLEASNKKIIEISLSDL